MRILASVLGSSLVLLGCGGAADTPTSEVKFNIDVPKDNIDPADIAELLSGLGSFVQEGSRAVALADVVERINVSGSFKTTLQQIVESRDKDATVTCTGRKCLVVSNGQKFNFKLEGVSIPVLGTPSISLSQRIELQLELSADEQHFNACRISGMKVNTGILSPNVDGALIKLENGQLNTLKIDAGPGGDYPNTSCQ